MPCAEHSSKPILWYPVGNKKKVKVFFKGGGGWKSSFLKDYHLRDFKITGCVTVQCILNIERLTIKLGHRLTISGSKKGAHVNVECEIMLAIKVMMKMIYWKTFFFF